MDRPTEADSGGMTLTEKIVFASYLLIFLGVLFLIVRRVVR